MKYFFYVILSLFYIMRLYSQTQSYNAVRAFSEPIIDGYGDDEIWKQAPIAKNFVQREPYEGDVATEQTEFKILFDDKNIYVYAMMYDSSPDSIVARLARRDDFGESDFFGIGFDSYHDKQTAFIFVVLASGTKVDFLTYNDGNDDDYSWDPVWETETKILPNGWSAEMKIPLSQLRFTEGVDTWGMDVARKIVRKQEESNWQLMSKTVNGFVSQFGTMTGMKNIQLPQRVEVMPYGVATSEHYPQTATREKMERLYPNLGADVKYSVTSNFTLDATFNPDFAQVEADPSVLNLTTFETFYPEKRPFFIEGTQILRFVTFGGDFGPGLFYSRRIGKAITVHLPSDGKIITQEPHTTTILGAAKFSGKTEGGTSIGLLTALTNEEVFSYRDTLGNIRTMQAEPMSSYNLLRIKQDFLGNSNIGVIGTVTGKENKNPAFTSGIDWDIKLQENNYRINGFFAHSRIRTMEEELREGNAGKVNIGKVSGEWVYSLSYDFTSRKYFINDLGFFNSPNDYGWIGNIAYRNFDPGNYFRSYDFSFVPHLRRNFDGLTLFNESRINFNAQLQNYWWVHSAISYSKREKDPYDPRGYGVYNFPSSYFARMEIQTDSRKLIIIEVEENFRRNKQGATITNTAASFLLRPTTAMEYQLTAGYSTERRFNAYADTIMNNSQAIAVFGRRDVDGTDLTLRSSILFTHALSLQMYSQFFWAKGRYRDFSLLLNNGELQKYDYKENVDFNITSLISNVVLRWEYREGSTFYFVWSHERAFRQRGIAGTYQSTFANSVDNTFHIAPNNSYVVKVSYWLTL